METIGVWGWGYGGYVATLLMAHDIDAVFKCGIAVAPIAKWEFYSEYHPAGMFL